MIDKDYVCQAINLVTMQPIRPWGDKAEPERGDTRRVPAGDVLEEFRRARYSVAEALGLEETKHLRKTDGGMNKQPGDVPLHVIPSMMDYAEWCRRNNLI